MMNERDHIEAAARLLDGDDHAMNDHLHGQPPGLSDKTDLTAAIAWIRTVTPTDEPWKAQDLVDDPDDWTDTDEAIAAILNAVVSGDLVPAARRPTVAGGNGSAVRGW